MSKIKIEGMTCGHCAAAVEKALAQVPGVSRVVEVSVERGEALVEGEATAEQLISAITEEGYSAQLI